MRERRRALWSALEASYPEETIPSRSARMRRWCAKSVAASICTAMLPGHVLFKGWQISWKKEPKP